MPQDALEPAPEPVPAPRPAVATAPIETPPPPAVVAPIQPRAEPAPVATVVDPPKPAPAPVVAAVTPVETPAPAPAPAAEIAIQPAAKPATPDGWRVHMASLRSEAAAQTEWQRLKQRHAGELGDMKLIVESVDLPEKGRFYRVLAGPIVDKDKADQLCAILSASDQYCRALR